MNTSPVVNRFMEVLENKTDKELIQSLLAECAKANNEIRCGMADIQKAKTRLKFCVLLANKLIERKGDQ